MYARRECLHGISNNACLHHMTSGELINLIGKELYQSFFKFAFVRNPWDRCVSEYAFLQMVESPLVSDLSFTQFVEKLPVQEGTVPGYIYQHLRPQSNYLFDEKGNRLVDYIGKFEELIISWDIIVREVRNRSGVDLPKQLPKAHASKHDHYSRYYDSHTRDWIARVYEADIENHHYQFEIA